jgi:uncharacterized membrane protein HdeD (DUF308 family)
MIKEQVMTGARLGGELSPGRDLPVALLARNWWAIGLRGVLAVVFGLVALFLPSATMLSLVLVFAIYAFADGVFGIVSAVRVAQACRRWGLLVFEGVVNIAASVIAMLWPGSPWSRSCCSSRSGRQRNGSFWGGKLRKVTFDG